MSGWSPQPAEGHRGRHVPIHLATPINRDCPRVPARAANIAMNSPDMSRFCRNAEYREASVQPNSTTNSHCNVKAVRASSSAQPRNSLRLTQDGSSDLPNFTKVTTIATSASPHTMLKTPWADIPVATARDA